MTRKLRLPFLDAIHFCHPKDHSEMVKGPLSAAVTDFFSPCNSRSFHLSFPTFPDPPSTPDSHSMRHNVFPSSKPCTMHSLKSELDDDFSSHAYYSKTRQSGKESDPSTIEKKTEKPAIRKPNANHKTESYNPSKTVTEEEPLNGGRRSTKTRRFRAQRFNRFDSKDWKEDTETSHDNQSRERKLVSRRAMPRLVDKRVVNDENFVVVKRSEDPYEDFKKSMLEMIVEKQIFEPKELEQLLMSFLSLNSRLHHRVILQAFTHILREVYSASSI